MKYYRNNKTHEVWALESDGSQDYLITDEFTEMTEKEVSDHINPHVSEAQLVAEAEVKKQTLITETNQKTQLWQIQLMLDIITDEDKTSLTEWMLYVQKVQAVDTSAAPDIIWPEKPE